MDNTRFPKPAPRRSSPTTQKHRAEQDREGGREATREGRSGRPDRDRRDPRPDRDRRAPRPERDRRAPRPERDSQHRQDARKGRAPESKDAKGRTGGHEDRRPPKPFRPRPVAAETSPAEDFSASAEVRGVAAPHAAEEQTTLLPGLKPVLELLESAPERVDSVFLRKGRHSREMDRIADLCRENGVRFSLLEAAAFARIYPGKSQGVVARLFEAGYVDLEEMLHTVMDSPMPLVLALDQVQDPGNAGTLARTLYALGGLGLVIPRHNGVYLGAAASRSAAGALEKLPVAKAANLGQALDKAKDMGFTIYGATSRTTAPAHEGGLPRAPEARAHAQPIVDIFSSVPRFPAVLVLGGEEGGLRPGMEKRCDILLRIPMLRDFDSLNVAQAGAIILAWLSSAAKKSR